MNKITKILCPVDFSQNADRIITDAAYIAGSFKAALHVVFVVQHFEDYSGFFVPPVNLPNLEQELVESSREQMESFIKKHDPMFTEKGAGQVTSKVLSGDVSESILHYVKENNCDLIVMGTHGYKGLERIMFGSVADKVIKTASCPVLSINPYRAEE